MINNSHSISELAAVNFGSPSVIEMRACGASFQWTHAKGSMICGTVSHWYDFDGSDSSDVFHEYDRLVGPNSPEGLGDG